MLNKFEILETINMINNEKLDIRTITMGISLFDCSTDNLKTTLEKIYNKIYSKAKNLVKVGEELEKTYGIPIVNKRISVTPISLVAASTKIDNYTPFAEILDKVSGDLGVNFIGGFTSLVQKGFLDSDRVLFKSIAEALSKTKRVCSSVAVASTQAGINMDAVKELGFIIKDLAYRTKEENSIGCAKFVVFANPVTDNPFMAGAFLGVGEAETVINVGVSGPGVVKSALENVRGADFEIVSETIKKTAFKITRAGQLIAKEAAKRLNCNFGIVDLSLAPTPTIGDSVAHILEEMGLEVTGAYGTTMALMLLNDAVKKGGVMASSSVGGLSGAFIPVSEDLGMINAVEKGALTLEKLEAMTSVCSVGLDMIAIPGDVEPELISGIIADEMAIGVINSKTTAVRIIPVYGKDVGDSVEFGGLLGKAPIININRFSQKEFIKRGGRVPAPLNSLKN